MIGNTPLRILHQGNNKHPKKSVKALPLWVFKSLQNNIHVQNQWLTFPFSLYFISGWWLVSNCGEDNLNVHLGCRSFNVNYFYVQTRENKVKAKVARTCYPFPSWSEAARSQESCNLDLTLYIMSENTLDYFWAIFGGDFLLLAINSMFHSWK